MENDGQNTFSNLKFPEVEDDAKRTHTQAVYQESFSTQPPPYWLKIALLECLKRSFAVRRWGEPKTGKTLTYSEQQGDEIGALSAEAGVLRAWCAYTSSLASSSSVVERNLTGAPLFQTTKPLTHFTRPAVLSPCTVGELGIESGAGVYPNAAVPGPTKGRRAPPSLFLCP